MKSLNYSKIQFKALIYFELQEFELKLRIEATSNYTPVKFPSNQWNFELTMYFKHEMIGFLPKFQRKFELSGTLN